MKFESVRQAFINGLFRYTKHGLEQRIKRQISSAEIEEAVLSGEVIEDYPSDKYGPSCLIFGKTSHNRPLHVQIVFYPIITVVTVYEPSPEKWIDYRERRK